MSLKVHNNLLNELINEHLKCKTEELSIDYIAFLLRWLVSRDDIIPVPKFDYLWQFLDVLHFFTLNNGVYEVIDIEGEEDECDIVIKKNLKKYSKTLDILLDVIYGALIGYEDEYISDEALALLAESHLYHNIMTMPIKKTKMYRPSKDFDDIHAYISFYIKDIVDTYRKTLHDSMQEFDNMFKAIDLFRKNMMSYRDIIKDDYEKVKSSPNRFNSDDVFSMYNHLSNLIDTLAPFPFYCQIDDDTDDYEYSNNLYDVVRACSMLTRKGLHSNKHLYLTEEDISKFYSDGSDDGL